MEPTLDHDLRCREAAIELSASIVITIFLSLALFCLSLLLLLFFKPETPSERNRIASPAIAGLSTTHLQQLDILLGNEDYRKLRATPDLKALSVKFRRDRRRIALLWLGELQRDVRIVWKFRRFLVRNGLPVTFREELAIAFGASLAVLYLKTVWFLVFVSGPFVLSEMIRSARLPVERLSMRGASLLARAPASTRTQIEQRWAKHVLAMHRA